MRTAVKGPRAEIEVIVSAPVTVSISPSKTKSICATGILNKDAVLQAIPSGNGTFTYQTTAGIITNETANSITVAQ
jgi:hypothetical protein